MLFLHKGRYSSCASLQFLVNRVVNLVTSSSSLWTPQKRVSITYSKFLIIYSRFCKQYHNIWLNLKIRDYRFKEFGCKTVMLYSQICFLLHFIVLHLLACGYCWHLKERFIIFLGICKVTSLMIGYFEIKVVSKIFTNSNAYYFCGMYKIDISLPEIP